MEAAFHRWLHEQLGGADAWGFADDTGRLAAPNAVVTTDMLLEGVHFLRDAGWEAVGRKALAVNLSDLAATAAKPLGAVCSLALPRAEAAEAARAIITGMLPLLDRYEMQLVGGDTNVWDGPAAVDMTVWGEPLHGPWHRSGGRPGDRLLVTGPLGGSLLGRHLTFEPRVEAALAIAQRFEVHAAMDITDGLALDLSRLATASNCGAEIDLRAAPIAEAAYRRAAESGRPAVEHALSDGEDFELLLALPYTASADLLRCAPRIDALRDLQITDIGSLTEGLELRATQLDGSSAPLPVHGYLHGAENGS